jgi:hypothetical protein
MKIGEKLALRRVAMALVAAGITAATFGAINAAVVPPTSRSAVVQATTVVATGLATN